MIDTLPGVTFRLMSAVPQFDVRPHGLGRFILRGVVPAFADPALELRSRPGDVDVPLAENSQPRDAARALQRRLPRGVRADVHDVEGGVEISFQETLIPAAQTPRVLVMSTDARQRVRVLDENRFELLGATGDDCLITLMVDRRKVVVAIAKGTSAEDTATLLAARAPWGYVGRAEGSIVTIWKDADQTEIAA